MHRPLYLEKIKQQFRVHSVCALLGPRQVGKTTLAHMYTEKYFKNDFYFFDLENPLDLVRLENPMIAFAGIEESCIVIDEIQRRPNLFTVIRVLVDSPDNKKKFLILGSASRDLIKQSSETLAGRIGYIELPPFSLQEVENDDRLWLWGGFPRSYLAETNEDSYLWRQSYIITFLERDIPALGFSVPAEELRRFWMMLSHFHGQICNVSQIGQSLQVSGHMVRNYLDILAGTFMIKLLSPWFENTKKRQIKSPKIYFRDSGILHALVGIKSKKALLEYPKIGAFWEGFAFEQVALAMNALPQECYFWATQAGAEIDLLIIKDGKRYGFEFKYSDSPRVTKSMRIALEDLSLDFLGIVYPGNKNFLLDKDIFVLGLQTIHSGDFVEYISRNL